MTHKYRARRLHLEFRIDQRRLGAERTRDVHELALVLGRNAVRFDVLHLAAPSVSDRWVVTARPSFQNKPTPEPAISTSPTSTPLMLSMSFEPKPTCSVSVTVSDTVSETLSVTLSTTELTTSDTISSGIHESPHAATTRAGARWHRSGILNATLSQQPSAAVPIGTTFLVAVKAPLMCKQEMRRCMHSAKATLDSTGNTGVSSRKRTREARVPSPIDRRWLGPVPAIRYERHYGDRVVRCFAERPRNAYDLLAEAAARHPDGEAIVTGPERLSPIAPMRTSWRGALRG